MQQVRCALHSSGAPDFWLGHFDASIGSRKHAGPRRGTMLPMAVPSAITRVPLSGQRAAVAAEVLISTLNIEPEGPAVRAHSPGDCRQRRAKCPK